MLYDSRRTLISGFLNKTKSEGIFKDGLFSIKAIEKQLFGIRLTYYYYFW
jgi:hypothetical protein